MKKLTTLFSVVALTFTLGAVGCKKKNAEEGKDPAMKPEEKGSAEVKAGDKPDDKKPAADDKKAADPAAPAAAGGDLPAECMDYKKMMDTYFTCDKIPQAARDAAKTGFQSAWDAWSKVPAGPARDALKDGCKAAADAAKAMTCPS